MNCKVLVITGAEFNPGFQMAGIRTHTVNTADEAREKIIEQLRLKEYGVVLVDESLLSDFDAKLKEKIFESDLPLVLTTPIRRNVGEKTPAEDEFLEFITKAIGYRIRVE